MDKLEEKPSFERIVKNYIFGRSWDVISSKWISHLPLIVDPGRPPESSVEDFFPLQESINNNYDNTKSSVSAIFNFYDEIDGFRKLLFSEGLFLLHKAAHVIGCAEISASQGILTWSIPNAYQSAFFGSKSIIRLLGITTVEYKNKYWIIDLFPEPLKKEIKSKKRVNDKCFESRFILSNNKLEHRHIWHIFQRVIRSCKFNNETLKNFSGAFSNLDVKDFAKQRNTLQYTNNKWFYNDLHNFQESMDFGKRSNLDHHDLEYLNEVSDFSLILAYSILYFGLKLLYDLGKKTNILKNEIDLLHNTLNEKRHPYFSKLGLEIG